MLYNSRIILYSSHPDILPLDTPPEYYKILRSLSYCPIQHTTALISGLSVSYRYTEDMNVSTLTLPQLTKENPKAIFHILKYLKDPRAYLDQIQVAYEVDYNVLTPSLKELPPHSFYRNHPTIRIRRNIMTIILPKGKTDVL